MLPAPATASVPAGPSNSSAEPPREYDESDGWRRTVPYRVTKPREWDELIHLAKMGAIVAPQSDAVLSEMIQAIHQQARGTYGVPHIYAELVEQGVEVGRKRVARLMHEAGIAGVSRRGWARTPYAMRGPTNTQSGGS